MAAENGLEQGTATSGDPSEGIGICPYLRLASDPNTAATYARRDHRCLHLGSERLSSSWQHQYCVSESHVQCPYYLGERRSENRRRLGEGWGKRIKSRARAIGVVLVLVLLIFVVLQVLTGNVLPVGLPALGGGVDRPSDTAQSDFISQPTPQPAPPGILFPSMDRSVRSDLGVDDQSGLNQEDGAGFADQRFRELWMRSDGPVRNLNIDRSWVWGPEPLTGGIEEAWSDSPSGRRLVQYFPKGRMEPAPTPTETSSSQLSGGLLASEMIEGHYQTGVSEYDETPEPADVPIAGNDETTGLPTYADINQLGLLDRPTRTAPGDVIAETIAVGAVEHSLRYADWDVTVQESIPATGHSIASVFGDYLESEVTIFQDGEYVLGQLFEDRFHLVGLPITDAYWATVDVNGAEVDLLWQCFERRCLTYAPENEPGFQIESGDTGLHYYEWRYGQLD